MEVGQTGHMSRGRYFFATADDGQLFAVDQLAIPDSAVLRFGGLHEPDILIAGEVNTTGVTAAAIELHRATTRLVSRLALERRSVSRTE